MGARRGGRMGLIIIVLIIIVLVVAVIGFVLFNAVTSGGNAGTGGGGQATAAPTVVSTTKLLVASHDIRRGTRLAQTDVDTEEWPLSLPLPPDSMTVTDAAGPEQVEGMIAKVDILKGQPIQTHLIAAEKDFKLQASGSDAALLIPSGQVAVAFPLSRLAGVAYALRQGDHIDVLMSFRFVSVDKDFQTILPNNIGGVQGATTTGGGSSTPSVLVNGREENGPFGTKIMVIPSEKEQRPRQVTQLVIKNAIVLRVGDWPLTDLNSSIVVTPAPQETATQAPQGSSSSGAAAAPTPIPISTPDIVTVVMSRQDALVLKYSLETGADIDFALRSALDNDVTDVSTDSVTLQYLMDFYDIVEPPLMPIAQQPRPDSLITPPTGDFPLPVNGTSPTPPPT